MQIERSAREGARPEPGGSPASADVLAALLHDAEPRVADAAARAVLGSGADWPDLLAAARAR